MIPSTPGLLFARHHCLRKLRHSLPSGQWLQHPGDKCTNLSDESSPLSAKSCAIVEVMGDPILRTRNVSQVSRKGYKEVTTVRICVKRWNTFPNDLPNYRGSTVGGINSRVHPRSLPTDGDANSSLRIHLSMMNTKSKTIANSNYIALENRLG